MTTLELDRPARSLTGASRGFGYSTELGATTIAIVEDNRLLRDGLAHMLNALSDLRVVLAATSFDTTRLRPSNPRVALLDVGMQGTKCLRLVETVRQELADCQIIVMDVLPVNEDIADLVNAGAAGFILRDASAEDFVETIRSVATGSRVLPPRMTATLFEQITRAARRRRTDVMDGVRMTQREGEMISLIALGMSNKEIAVRLNIATDTVKSHVRNVMDKLALRTRLQIAAYAHQRAD